MSAITSALLVAAVAGTQVSLDSKYLDVKTKFNLYKERFSKNYSDQEHSSRFSTFVANDAKIAAHNAKGKSWTLGHNEFSDMTEAEFSEARINGYKANTRPKNYAAATKADVADSVDWVAKGAVTPVKDQGQCGSCWAFSTTGSFEGAYAIATGSLLSFSEQDLVSCDKAHDQGCNGGLMDNAFGYIKESGICTEGDYPYTSGGGNSGTCKTTCSPAATLTGFTDVANEAGMIAALNVGPVSVAVEADKSAWQFYSGGVLDDAGCGTSLDHGVLAVGYGTDGKDYYNVKNSWGASWGESGYIRLVQGKNQCGIASAASYPTGVSGVAPPAPTPPTPAPAPTPPAPKEVFTEGVYSDSQCTDAVEPVKSITLGGCTKASSADDYLSFSCYAGGEFIEAQYTDANCQNEVGEFRGTSGQCYASQSGNYVQFTCPEGEYGPMPIKTAPKIQLA